MLRMMHHLVIWFVMQQKTAQVANLIMGIAAGLWFLAVMRRVLHAMKLNHFLKLMEVPIEIRLVNFPVSEAICLKLYVYPNATSFWAPDFFVPEYGCLPLKNQTLYGIGQCNDELNTKECFYDNGDCCLKVIDASNCVNCTCHLSHLRIVDYPRMWKYYGFRRDQNAGYKFIYKKSL